MALSLVLLCGDVILEGSFLLTMAFCSSFIKEAYWTFSTRGLVASTLKVIHTLFMLHNLIKKMLRVEENEENMDNGVKKKNGGEKTKKEVQNKKDKIT